MEKPTVAILGLGALGQSLLRRFHQVDIPVACIYSSDPTKRQRFADQFDTQAAEFPNADTPTADVLFITVSDDAIGSVAEHLAESDYPVGGTVVTHCSGAHLSNKLQPLTLHGAEIAAFHPLQTFSEENVDPNLFQYIFITVEGTEKATGTLRLLGETMGARPISVSKAFKQRLHIAAVLACNYLTTLMQLAEDMVVTDEEEDYPPTLEMLEPLIRQTIEGILDHGPQKVLSGPIARGDQSTIRQHLNILEEEDELDAFYRFMGRYTAKLAHQGQKLSAEKRDAILKILKA
ncbi:MAG: Rossmann-like and DUF2520 domain-containing protein [Bacteroidota bacterium]